MKLTEKTTGSQLIYHGKIITLKRDTVELENGSTALREVIHHPGGVGVVAIDKDDRVLMVRQFRYPFSSPLLEIPAGKLEYGEDAFLCGQRELEEETGCTAAFYYPLGQLFPTPAYDNEIIHLFYAKNLTQTVQHLDDDEFLAVEPLPFDRVLEMVLKNEIRDAKTQIAILKVKLLRESGLL